MKKLLTILLVLVIASAASAGTAWLEVDPQDQKPSYSFSDIITINLVGDPGITGVQLDALASDNGGTAGSPLFLNDILSDLRSPGYLVNQGGILLNYVTGSAPFGSAGVPPGDPAWSFEFHVPDVPPSTEIIIFPFVDYDLGYFDPMISFSDYSMAMDVGPLIIHVPEPMTIALLGLGGLFLRRRK
jgi:hypothetical protein